MIITGISLNQTPLDWEENKNRILESLEYYSKTDNYTTNQSHIVVFPELALSGYGCEDGFLFSDTKEKSFTTLLEIIKFSNQITKALIFLGLPFYYRGSIFNCMAIIHSGTIVGMIPKSFLAGEGLHYEPRWFTSYHKKFSEIAYNFKDKIYKFYFGKGIIEWNGIRIGVEICEDSWVNKRPANQFYDLDIDLLLNPAASHFGFGKWNLRKNIAISSSLYFHCYYFSVNLLGNESGKAIYDGGFLLSKQGTLLYEEQSFSFCDVLIRSFCLDLSDLKNKRDRIYSRRKDRKLNLNKFILQVESKKEIKKPIFSVETPNSPMQEYKNIIDYISIMSLPDFEENDSNPKRIFIEFLEVERLGLFDYLRKTKSKGYTISLSGGVDSSVSAILVHQMIRKGIQELGLQNFIKKINFKISADELKKISSLSLEDQIKHFSQNMIWTIYQKTKQNSEETKIQAEELSKEIYSTHYTIDIQKFFEDIISLMENLFQKKISWEENNIPLQNLQARIRSVLSWFVANISNTILLSTSNRSEGSVGYTTMDGDTSGGLAPIAGVDKPFLLKFMEWIATYQDSYTKPIKVAKKILELPPTAELLPLEKNQTDEKDLMPYPILAMIERFAIEELLSPKEILEKFINFKNKKNIINTSLPYFDDFLKILDTLTEEEIKININTFFELWNKSQWKRERFATSFHLDSYNIDPRGWFRFPVLSGTLKIKD
ncbi:MAG: NAD(+) synthase [Leptonema sp. (in: bacteria)]